MAIGDVTAGSIAGQVHFSGLGNGTDFDTLITKLVQVEQNRSDIYKTWKQSWLDKNTAFKDLNAQMLTLRTSLLSMNTMGTFLAKSATTTSSTTSATVITATANGDAEVGSHTFEVKQLAQNKVMVTDTGYSSLTSNVNSLGTTATFNYTYKGVTVSNAIPASASLSDVMNIINMNPGNNGVRAITIYDGSRYYLQVRGLDTGAAASLAIASSTTLVGFGAANFDTSQNNQDAQLKVDGWPSGTNYISRPSNSVSDILTGITMNLKASGAGTITVATNVDSVVQNVQTFVNQVNLVRQKLLSLTKYDATTKQGSILTGNYGLQMINSIMNDITANMGVGFDPQQDRFSSLSSLNYSSNGNSTYQILYTDAMEGSTTEGMLLLNTTKLRQLLTTDANAVGEIFSANMIGTTNSADVSYGSYITNLTKGGTYDLKYTVTGGKIVSATLNGHPALFHSNSNTITGMGGYPEAGLSVRVNNLTTGSYDHVVRLKQGKIPELADELNDLTNATNGPLNILQKNYVTIADDIQKKIDQETARVSRLETHLRNQFAKLDALLGTYNQQGTALAQQISQMSQSS